MRKMGREKKIKPKFKIVDELKGISHVLLIRDTRDVAIYLVDVNPILKGQDPAWFCSEERTALFWFDPRSKPHKSKRKDLTTQINFGRHYKDYNVVHSHGRYTCFIVFFRSKLLDQAVEKQAYAYLEKH